MRATRSLVDRPRSVPMTVNTWSPIHVDAAHDGGVIAEVPVSMELDESVEAELDKLEGGGVFHRASCLHDIVCARSFIAATPALAARLLEERVRLMSLGQNMRSIGCGNASSVEREELGEG